MFVLVSNCLFAPHINERKAEIWGKVNRVKTVFGTRGEALSVVDKILNENDEKLEDNSVKMLYFTGSEIWDEFYQ